MPKRKNYSCDFETTTDPHDCSVWAYGWMEIGNKRNYKIGNSLLDFMTFAEKCQGNLYFHNLKFDGEFIVNWLLKNGFTFSKDGDPGTFNAVISGMGAWYMIDICYGYTNKNKKVHTLIYDSLKKLPFPVKKIAKDFKLPIMKGDIDYHEYRPPGHTITEKEYAYIKNDIEIVADALKIQFDQGLTQMTNASDSMYDFKATISKGTYQKLFPVFSFKMDKELKKAYKGGFTWLHERHEGEILKEGLVFDVNSLYPAIMKNRPLPVGQPIEFEGEYEHDDSYPLYIQHLKCEFELKENKIPTIQIKKNPFFRANQYLHNNNGEYVDLYVTNIDLAIIKEHYELYNVKYVKGWKFRQKQGIFDTFIDKWTYVKQNSEGAIKLLAKLQLNSLYGKFGKNPDVTGKVPDLNKETGACFFRKGETDIKDPIYTPMACFITSWARELTITTAQKCYDRIIYCDTDSIHLTGRDIPEAIADIIDDKKLGYWAHETTFKKAKYIRQKTYMYEACMKEKRKDGEIVYDDEGFPKYDPCVPEEATKTKVSVKCAGMPETVKQYVTFDNFNVGFTSMGKLAPKHVDGGVVLIDSPFTIK